MNLARLDASEKKWEEALETTNRVLKLNPYNFPEAYFYNSLANLNLRHVNAAADSAREAIKRHVDRRFPQVEYLLGISLAIQSRYQEAAVHMKRYLELAPKAANAATVRKQLAQLDAAMGKQVSSASRQ